MMPMTKQRLDIPLKLKSVSDSGEFEGYGSVFGVKDSYDDVVVPGAFSKSLQSWREKTHFRHALAAPDG
jgi:phage head maturation protease